MIKSQVSLVKKLPHANAKLWRIKTPSQLSIYESYLLAFSLKFIDAILISIIACTACGAFASNDAP